MQNIFFVNKLMFGKGILYHIVNISLQSYVITKILIVSSSIYPSSMLYKDKLSRFFFKSFECGVVTCKPHFRYILQENYTKNKINETILPILSTHIFCYLKVKWLFFFISDLYQLHLKKLKKTDMNTLVFFGQ